MNTVLRVLAEEAALRYAVNLAVGATAASAIGLLMALATRRNAALRQGFLTATILVVTAMPLLIIPERQGGLIRAASTDERASGYQAETFPVSVAQGETNAAFPQNVPGKEKVSSSQQPPVERARLAAFPVEKCLWGGLLVWGIGSVWCALRAVQSLLALRQVRARSVAAGTTWIRQTRQAAEAVGLAQVPPVAFAAGAGVPFSLGGRHPLILLPESAREIEAAEAEAILLHEAGHIVHRHHLLGLLMTAAQILYWWLPPVRWTNAALAEAMEEVCDNHVLRVQGDGRALGRCLVNAAEALANGLRVPPGSAILHGKRGLRRRLARVLAGAGNQETRMNRLGRAASVFVALACLGVCAMVRVTPVEAEEGPDAWARYFPMSVGSQWTYRTTLPGQQTPGELQMKVQGRIPLKQGGACVEVATSADGSRGGYLYAGLRKDGYYVYQTALPGKLGVNEDAPPTPLALFPLKAGQSWTWQEAGRGQTANKVGGASDTTECRATVEKTDEEVTVPAGRYRALRIRIQRKNRPLSDSEESVWYAKDVGMVQREDRSAGQNTPTSVIKLTRFLPGTRQEEAPEDMLPLIRKMRAEQSPPRALRALPLWNGRFLHHFAVSQGESGTRVFYRTMGAKVVVFDPLQVADWNRLLAEEGAEKPMFGPAGGISVAQEIGVLMAEGLGIDTDARTYLDQLITTGKPDGSLEMSFVVKGFPAKWSSMRLYLWVEVGQQGEITKLSFGPFDAADTGLAPASEKTPR